MPARRDHSLPATRTPPPASAVKTANAPITLNYMALWRDILPPGCQAHPFVQLAAHGLMEPSACHLASQ